MPTIDAHGALHDNEGRYANQNKPSAGFDLDAQPTQPDVAWDTDPSATNQIKHYLAAETAVGGPEAMTAAKTALWRTALWSSTVEYNADDPDGEGDPTDEAPLGIAGFTADDIDPESRAKVEADFETWMADNSDAVKTFTQTVTDPDGGDPAEFLAHNWWLTRNGHGAGFKDRLHDDPTYAEAVREAEDRKRALIDAVGAVRDNNARIKAQITGAESDLIQADHALEKITGSHVTFEKDDRQPTGGVWVAHVGQREYVFDTKGEAQRHTAEMALDDITPMRVLHEKAQAADTEWRRNYGAGYRKLHDGRSTAKTYSEAQGRENRAYAAKQKADSGLRRAEALTALDQATPAHEYEVYVNDSGQIAID